MGWCQLPAPVEGATGVVPTTVPPMATLPPWSMDTGTGRGVDGVAPSTRLVSRGAEVLPVGAEGVVLLGALEETLDEAFAVVSVMWVNNETGVVQDIAGLATFLSSRAGEYVVGQVIASDGGIVASAGTKIV